MRNTQCQKLLQMLINGDLVTSLTAVSQARCVSLQRRLSDLRESGIVIHDKWIKTPTGKRVKSYYIPEYMRGRLV